MKQYWVKSMHIKWSRGLKEYFMIIIKYYIKFEGKLPDEVSFEFFSTPSPTNFNPSISWTTGLRLILSFLCTAPKKTSLYQALYKTTDM